jgi:hypothetical protein
VVSAANRLHEAAAACAASRALAPATCPRGVAASSAATRNLGGLEPAAEMSDEGRLHLGGACYRDDAAALPWWRPADRRRSPPTSWRARCHARVRRHDGPPAGAATTRSRPPRRPPRSPRPAAPRARAAGADGSSVPPPSADELPWPSLGPSLHEAVHAPTRRRSGPLRLARRPAPGAPGPRTVSARP